MPVSVMGIRDVWVVVRHCQMLVPVAVGLLNRPLVFMPVMLVVNVSVLVLQDFVSVLVAVPGGEEHGDTTGHEEAGRGVTEGCPLVKERYGEQRTSEGRCRKEGGFASST